MSEKTIKFDPEHISKKRDIKSELQEICLGTIFLDLMLNYDGTQLMVRPSFELEDGIDDSTIEQFRELFKKYLPEIIDVLFNLYQSP